jgi:hypothetical protein
MYYQVTRTDSAGTPLSISWGIYALKKPLEAESFWTGGVAPCGSGQIGV